jgi:hypothetical protein
MLQRVMPMLKLEARVDVANNDVDIKGRSYGSRSSQLALIPTALKHLRTSLHSNF